MKHLFLTFLLLATTLRVFAQKIKVEDDLITVDGQPYARIEKDGCGVTTEECMYRVRSLQNQPLFVVKTMQFNDPAKVSTASPSGQTMYVQYIFTASHATAETAYPSLVFLRALDVARKIYKAHLIKDGTLDQQAADNFVLENGMTYSERRREINPQVLIVPGNR